MKEEMEEVLCRVLENPGYLRLLARELIGVMGWDLRLSFKDTRMGTIWAFIEDEQLTWKMKDENGKWIPCNGMSGTPNINGL